MSEKENEQYLENERVLEKTEEGIQEKKDLVPEFNISNPVKGRIQYEENELSKLEKEAEQMVENVLGASYVEETSKLKDFSQFGKSEEMSSDKMLMKNKTLAQLEGNAVKNDLADKLVNLRKTMSAITESQGAESKGFMDKIKRKIFKTKYVSDYVIKKENTEQVVSGIIGDLYRSRNVLIKDNSTLEMFEESSRLEIFELQRQIVLGEKLYEELKEREKNGEFRGKEHLFQEAMFKTLNRTKLLNDKLLQMYQASEAAKNIYKNNEKLIINIDEYSKAAESMMYVSIFISDSLSSQQAALKGVEEVKTFINDLMLSNSEMLAENASKVDDFMSSGILDIETAKKSLSILTKTIEEQELSAQRIIDESRRHIDEMSSLMSDVSKKYKNPDLKQD